MPCRPPEADLRWLGAFPSYGFLLSVAGEDLQEVLSRFAARDIAAAAIGRIDDSRQLDLCMQGSGCRSGTWPRKR
jgi:selenophosphate synthetase-related protein